MNPARALDRRATAVDDWVGTHPLRMAAVGLALAALILAAGVAIFAAVAVLTEPLFTEKPVLCPAGTTAVEYSTTIVCEDP